MTQWTPLVLIGAGPAVGEKHVNEKMLRYVQKTDM